MAKTICGIEITHQIIITWLCCATFLHNALCNGAMNVVISSLQKEFYLSSQESGVYLSFYDIGSVCCSVTIPLLAMRGKKPRWIAWGMFVLFVGSLTTALPHFLRTSDLMGDSATSSGIELCNSTNSSLNNHDTSTTPISPYNRKNKDSSLILGFLQPKHVLFIGNIVNGCSSASMQSVLISYLEDVIPHELTGLYESIYFVTAAFGMGFGFLFTSWCLTVNSDFHRITDALPEWLTTSHPNWVGAWWIPFLSLSFVSLIFCFTICFFPTSLDNNKKKLEAEEHVEFIGGDTRADLDANPRSLLQQTGSALSLFASTKNIKNIKESDSDKSFLRAFKNSMTLFLEPVFLCLVIGGTVEAFLQNSFLAFISLFLEYQYRISPGTASLVIGLLTLPPVFIGGLLGGQVCFKLKYKLLPIMKFIGSILLINALFYSGFFFYCAESTLVSSTNHLELDQGLFINSLQRNLTDTCFKTSANCNCDTKIFKPVCLNGSADIYYQSPCMAGCNNFNKDPVNNFYSQCSQANCPLYFNKNDQKAKTNDHIFVDGLCPRNSGCSLKLYLTFATVFMLMFFNSLLFTPYIKCLMWSVIPEGIDLKSDEAKKMNGVALGLKQFFMNAFGTIPGPILFGALIDRTCTYWHTDSQGQYTCKLYNNQNLALTFGFLGIGFKCSCLVLVVISIGVLRRREKK